MALGPTYVDGKTGQIDKDAVVAMLDGPVEVAESGADAADLWTALNTLGLVVEPA